MKNRIYSNEEEEFELTDEELKILGYLKKIEKLMKKTDRMMLFGHGSLDVRMGGGFYQHIIESFPGIHCDGGDGGDRY